MKNKPNRIYELRRSRGISQEKLAEELNVTQASISLYENGSNIPSDMLISISAYFDVTIEYLLKITDETRDKESIHLSSEEYNVLAVYRNIPTRYKKAVDNIINLLMKNLDLL